MNLGRRNFCDCCAFNYSIILLGTRIIKVFFCSQHYSVFDIHVGCSPEYLSLVSFFTTKKTATVINFEREKKKIR